MTTTGFLTARGKWFSIILLFSFAALSFAFDVPPLTGRIVDQTGFFRPGGKRQIEQTIIAFEKVTGGQIFVAVLKPLKDVSLEEAGIALMDKWKPGIKGKDNGAVLLILPESRQMRLEIGYGWEGQVNDAKAGDIIRMMAPYFQRGLNEAGVTAAIRQLAFYITGRKLPSAGNQPDMDMQEDEIPPWAAVIVVILLIIIGIRYPWLLLLFLGGGRGGGGGGFGGGFSGGGGGRGGGGGASGRW